VNINEQITDDELEDCFEGSSNIDMVREILAKPGVVVGPGIVDDDF